MYSNIDVDIKRPLPSTTLFVHIGVLRLRYCLHLLPEDELVCVFHGFLYFGWYPTVSV